MTLTDEQKVIRSAVLSGFYDRSEIEDQIDDLVSDDPEIDPGLLRAFAEGELIRKAKAEQTWPKITDCDRLDLAFDALAIERVLALQNAGFTMADGHSEAAEALAGRPKDRYFGYCFYHYQDIETALQGAGLWIAFDHVQGEFGDRGRVALVVVAALKAVGLPVGWGGDVSRRIEIPAFDWKRRFKA